MSKKVHSRANYKFLEGIARQLDVTLQLTPNDKLAQDLYEQGIAPAWSKSWEPKEQVFMLQILSAIGEKTHVPEALVVYMNDREFIHVEEDLPTLVAREKALAFRDLIEGVETATSLLRDRRG